MSFIYGIMIWILVLLFIGAGIGMGLRLGAIPTTFSFLWIVLATSLAGLVGKLFRLLLPHVGFEDPTLVWVVAPISGFFLLYVVFMAVGFEVHRRTYVFYKYKAGDLRLALWERLNMRLGACMGVLNGTAWLVLVSFVIFNFTYWTAQIAPSDNETRTTRIINGLGQGLESTGLNKAARAVGSLPDSFYQTANFAGLLAQNPALSQRLANYPAFLSVAERDDVQQIAQDGGLADAWKQGQPMGQILNSPQVKTILKDTNLTDTVWSIILTNMDDLTNYLLTGESPKYDSEKIIGRWNFTVVPSLAALRDANPKINAKEMKELRAVWTQEFANTTLVAGTDGGIFLKNVPDFTQHPPAIQTWDGQWSGDDSPYDISLNVSGQTVSGTATTDGLRLTIKAGTITYVFDRAN
jgi:hypothetical protein